MPKVQGKLKQTWLQVMWSFMKDKNKWYMVALMQGKVKWYMVALMQGKVKWYMLTIMQDKAKQYLGCLKCKMGSI